MADAPEKSNEKQLSGPRPRTTATVQKSPEWAMAVVLLGGIILVVVLGIFLFTQFGPKPVPEINWQANSPALNVYPGATLIASDSSQTDAYRHVWRLYASKDGLDKIKSFYQDQFLGLGYAQDTGNSQAFPLSFIKEEQNRCQYVRYGLDVMSLDENTIDLPGVNPDDLKQRYPGQAIFVVHQFDTSTREPTC